MAWTTPKTWASGDVLTAADMNTYVRDQIRFLGHFSTGGGPCARRHHTAAQNGISTGAVLAWNTDEFTPVGWDVPGGAGGNTVLQSTASPQNGFFILGANCRAGLTYSSGVAVIDIGIFDTNNSIYLARSTISQSATGGVHLAITSAASPGAFVGEYSVVINYANYSNVDIAANAGTTPNAFWGVWVGLPE